MEVTTAIQLATTLAALFGQLAPLAVQLKAALETGDEAQAQDLLKRLQAANDALALA